MTHTAFVISNSNSGRAGDHVKFGGGADFRVAGCFARPLGPYLISRCLVALHSRQKPAETGRNRLRV
jgi:hypothetical protein